MSHVADVDLKITDLDALEDVCQRHHASLRRGQTTHKWYGQFLNDWGSQRAAVNRRDPKTFGTCEHAIRLNDNPEGYEIGLTPRLDGEFGWDAVYDAYGPGGAALERAFGTGLIDLKCEYAEEVATRELLRKGWRQATKTTTETGDVQIEFVKY